MELSDKQLEFIQLYMRLDSREDLIHALNCEECQYWLDPGCGCCGYSMKEDHKSK